MWAVSTSPMLYGDWVIVTPWGSKAAVVALEKTTGRTAWETPNPRGVVQDYQSPTGMTLGGRDMILALGRQGYMLGIDARTGTPLWEYAGFPAREITSRALCPSATAASS